jgi:hypothetical protein
MNRTKFFVAMVIIVSILSQTGCKQATGNRSGKHTDWPQFLGPDRNSTSPQQGLLRSWPESDPQIVWSVEVGRGYGGPVVH